MTADEEVQSDPIPERPSVLQRVDCLLKQEVVQVTDEDQEVHVNEKLQFKVNVELIRFIAYIFFWTMCILAIILTNTVVAPSLLEGPTDGKSCPPFENGEGFDIFTDSHLIRTFGFNNICSNWDYSPSREITAAYYPLFEYSLLLYLLFDYLTVSLHYKKGLVSKRFYWTFKIFFPVLIIGSAWFRLIFVGIAYINVSAHTFGFLMLQLVLIAVASFNVWFIVEAKLEYKAFRGYTHQLAYLYLFCNTIISGLKVSLTAYVVITGVYPSWANTPSTPDASVVPGQIIDYIWMVFNAVLPVIFSLIRSRSENLLELVVDFKALAEEVTVRGEMAESLLANDEGGTLVGNNAEHVEEA